jgi:hypothetical protein
MPIGRPATAAWLDSWLVPDAVSIRASAPMEKRHAGRLPGRQVTPENPPSLSRLLWHITVWLRMSFWVYLARACLALRWREGLRFATGRVRRLDNRMRRG